MRTEQFSDLPELLVPHAAAELLGVSVHTLRQWRIHRRHLPFVRVGGRIRYRLDTIKRFMELGTSMPQGE